MINNTSDTVKQSGGSICHSVPPPWLLMFPILSSGRGNRKSQGERMECFQGGRSFVGWIQEYYVHAWYISVLHSVLIAFYCKTVTAQSVRF